ncbi:MAG: hypothetical protein ACRC1I_10060 [Pseudomonas proteolytica]|uniref:hypothetical protein n=1 Tax=Pseudomonas proteolytica TaxID=219574 RepID=UPI003F371DEE
MKPLIGGSAPLTSNPSIMWSIAMSIGGIGGSSGFGNFGGGGLGDSGNMVGKDVGGAQQQGKTDPETLKKLLEMLLAGAGGAGGSQGSGSSGGGSGEGGGENSTRKQMNGDQQQGMQSMMPQENNSPVNFG